MHPGKIMLRLDSAMNISPEFYNEYSKSYDSELLEYYGGGCLHFCGKGDHYIESLCEIEKLYGINLSQPHLNDMDKIFRAVSEKGKRIVDLSGAHKLAEEYNVKRGMIQQRN